MVMAVHDFFFQMLFVFTGVYLSLISFFVSVFVANITVSEWERLIHFIDVLSKITWLHTTISAISFV